MDVNVLPCKLGFGALGILQHDVKYDAINVIYTLTS